MNQRLDARLMPTSQIVAPGRRLCSTEVDALPVADPGSKPTAPQGRSGAELVSIAEGRLRLRAGALGPLNRAVINRERQRVRRTRPQGGVRLSGEPGARVARRASTHTSCSGARANGVTLKKTGG